MVTRISKSPEETKSLGAELGRGARAGDVVGLIGDLGAGKTQFVKGFAEGMEVPDRIQSPSFTLLNEHRSGRLPLYHIDLYRLGSAAEVHGAGLDGYIPSPDGVTLIEWFDRLGEIKLPRIVVVWIDVLGETERRIRYEDRRA